MYYQKYLGSYTIIDDSNNIADEYMKISQKDKYAADVLFESGAYNQSAYYYIQSMEKYIKYYICKKIDMRNENFSKKVRELGHSFNDAVDFLIDITSGNDFNLKKTMKKQLKQDIFKCINFNKLYNNCRYPYYASEGAYRITVLTQKDCKELKNIYAQLREYMKQVYVRI